MLLNNKKKKIIIRRAEKEDVDRLIEIEHKAWGKDLAANKEMILSRLAAFPEGMNCAIVENQIRGFCSMERINLEGYLEKDLTWYVLSDNGYITKSHNKNGRSIYGVSISVDPKVSDKRVAVRLYESCGKLAIKLNLEKIFLGSRVPKYHKYSKSMNINDYVYAITKRGRPLDPELALYRSIGMNIEKIVPNYFIDPESENYGVIGIRQPLFGIQH